MPIALVAHLKGSSTNGNGFTTSSIDTTSANLLVAVLVDHGGNAAFADSKGNTWLTAISPQSGAPGSSPYIRIIYVKAPTVGSGHTFTVTVTFGNPFLAVAAFSGADTAAPLDRTSFATNTFANTLQAGSITPTAANEVVVAGALVRATGTLSIDSSYILTETGLYVGGTAYGGGLAYIVQSAAAATNPTWTLSGGLAGAQIASFKSGAPPAPSAPSGLTATVVSSSAINLSWTASTGSVTNYSVERCSGAGCSTFTVVGTPTTTTFSDTGLTASTSYTYRVLATGAGGSSGYSATATAVTPAAGPPPATVTVRTVASTVTFASVALTDVISARGQVSADGGWPTCSVFVTAKPATGNEEDTLIVVAGAGNNVTRFTGRVRRFRPSAFPKGIEIVAMGTLAYAAEWAPAEDLIFDDEFPSGATDQALVAWALGFVPGVSYVGANIEGTGITLGLEAPEAFDWRAGVSAWQYVQQLDRATLYRTYQQRDGTIRRVQMIGHPSSTTTTFTLANLDILEGSTGDRNTEQTRNAAIVRGHDYGDNLGPVLGMAYGANDFQGDGTTASLRHPEDFSSDLIEDGSDDDGTPLGYGGIDAQDIADAILNDVNKEFVDASVQSWRDDTHGPGQTCLLNSLDRLAIGEKMWVRAYAWEVSDGWTSTYTLSGGGLEQPYTPPPT